MVYVFLVDGFEELEAVATIDILRRGGVDTITVSISESLEVAGSHDIIVKADRTLKDLPVKDLEMVILPGGPGVNNLLNCSELKEFVLQVADCGVKLAAICAAPSVLGAWGLLKGKNAVCYPGYEDKLVGAEYVDYKVVNDGGVITSKGAGTAHDFVFEIVKTLKDEETAIKVKKVMQYE